MAKTDIEFTGVKFTGFHFIGKPRRGLGGPAVRVFFEASWLEPIRIAMEWAEVDRMTVRGSVPLRGAIVGSEFVLYPADEGLAQHAIKGRAQKLFNFEVFFPEQTGKKEKLPVLRFRMETAMEEGEVKFGQWGRILNEALGRLSLAGGVLKKKAEHEKDDKDENQGNLELTGPAKEEHDARIAGKKKDKVH